MPAARSSIKRNILANSVAQVYAMLIGVVMAPVYLAYMGKEAYGLIGFFTMMSAWFQLLDMGLTPTLARETARYRGGAVGVDSLRALLRALETIFGVVSVIGAIALILAAPLIATHWLKVRDLPLQQVSEALMLMGLAVPLRWMAGLYRGVVTGFERQVWLGGYTVAIATLRFVGVLIVFVTFGATPVHFFAYQLLIAAAEMAGLVVMTYTLVRRGAGPREGFSWKPLLGNLGLSLTIAVSASIWVIVMQSDRLVLSKLLPLAEFGMFSIAVVAASAINSANGPFNQALLPRLTKLVAQGDEAAVTRLYSIATQAVCVLIAPAVVLLAFFPEPILRIWTGNPIISAHAAPILALYAIGNGFLCLNSFVYYIQYARGDLRLHFIGHILLLVLLVPAYLLLAPRFGAIGTGAAWAVVNALYFLFWTAIVHARVFRGHHMTWLTRDVLAIVGPTVLLAWALAMALSWPASRPGAFAILVMAGIALLAVAGAGSSFVRTEFAARYARWLARPAKDAL